MGKKGKWGIYLGGFALLVAIISVGFAYAAFSETLYINGEAIVEHQKWLIKFDNLGSATTTGSAVEVTQPTINTNDTKISKFSAQFKAPGDSITYTFDVVNDGTFDAKISSITGIAGLNTLDSSHCTNYGTANGANDTVNVCNNLSYELVYDDEYNTPVAITDTLTAGQTRSMKLILTYNPDTQVNELPEDDVKISNLDIAIIYSQS